MKRVWIIILAMGLLLTGCGKTTAGGAEGSECIDPGPPIIWHFYNMDQYFRLEEMMGNSDEELAAYLDEKRYHYVNEAPADARETAERARAMVRSVWVPLMDGMRMEFMDLQPEEGRESIFFRLEGDCAVHILYTFDEELEKKWLENLGSEEQEPIENEAVKRMYLTARETNAEGMEIYRFGCEVGDRYVRVFVFGANEQRAREIAEEISFYQIKERTEQ